MASDKPIVCKFGGTSLADAAQIRKAVDIVRADPRRRFVVVSAPGRRNAGDDKITDLLYDWFRQRHNPHAVEDIHHELIRRFGDIVVGLKLKDLDYQKHLHDIRRRLTHFDTPDFVASRGEYLNALIFARALDAEFVDADFVRFDALDRLDMAETERQARLIGLPARKGPCVIPGFYGKRPDGSIKTFSRGGSDLSGAVVAAVVDAEVYENWTDVDGIRMANPKIVPDARKIDVISFREIRELSYNGADVLHEEVVFPLYKKGIPIHVRNANRPQDEGSLVVPDDSAPRSNAGSIVGVAGKRDFTIVRIEKMLMNGEIGFIEKACSVFTHHKVSLECIPGGLDSICIAVASSAVKGKLAAIELELREACKPDGIRIIPEIALICTVGNAMVHAKGVAAKVFEAVRDADVNVSTIVQCASETSIIIGVENADCDKAVAAIYRAFER